MLTYDYNPGNRVLKNLIDLKTICLALNNFLNLFLFIEKNIFLIMIFGHISF